MFWMAACFSSAHKMNIFLNTNNEWWMTNDERRTAYSLLRHQIVIENNVELQLKQWNNKSIEWWRYLMHFWFSPTDDHDDDGDDTHPLKLIKTQLNDFCLFATHKMVFWNFFLFLLSIVDFNSRFVIGDCHRNNVSQSILFFNSVSKQKDFVYIEESIQLLLLFVIRYQIKCLPKELNQ